MSTSEPHLPDSRPGPSAGADRAPAGTAAASPPPSPGHSWRARRFDPNSSLGLRLTLASGAAFLLLVPFALLALLVLSQWAPLRELDRRVAQSLHSYVAEYPGWVRALQLWTDGFGPMPLRAVALVLVIWLLRRGARRLALWVVTTMLVGGLLGALLKLLVGRHRPDLLDPVAWATGYAFPSGHALNATLAAGVLLLVFLPFTRGRPAARWALWVGAGLLALVTGGTRIALGVHWVSDVVGGWLLGIAVLTATAAAFTTWRHQVGRRPVAPTREGIDPELAEPEPTGPELVELAELDRPAPTGPPARPDA